ncbi:MAG: phosphopantothenoylcysteine decarboxylase, partial [Armatimonadota bacterium]|nr:phosphopantothenoylcysteine decarboxylase [Armatimonadota bacterium]
EATLLLGPTRLPPPVAEGGALRVLPYTYFDELHALVRREVGSGRYHAFLHSAAVSDYAPVPCAGKIPSGQANLVLHLRPLPKIVDEVKDLDPRILLVKFKLEVDRSSEELIKVAQASREHSRAELIVANELGSIRGEAHPAFILGPEGVVAQVKTKEELARVLLDAVAQRLESGA